MVAHRDGEHFLGVVLADDEAVEVRLDVARLVAEMENVRRRFVGGGCGRLGRAAVGAVRLGERGEGNLVAEAAFEEIAELALDFLGGGEGFFAVGAGMFGKGHGRKRDASPESPQNRGRLHRQPRHQLHPFFSFYLLLLPSSFMPSSSLPLTPRAGKYDAGSGATARRKAAGTWAARRATCASDVSPRRGLQLLPSLPRMIRRHAPPASAGCATPSARAPGRPPQPLVEQLARAAGLRRQFRTTSAAPSP